MDGPKKAGNTAVTSFQKHTDEIGVNKMTVHRWQQEAKKTGVAYTRYPPITRLLRVISGVAKMRLSLEIQGFAGFLENLAYDRGFFFLGFVGV